MRGARSVGVAVVVIVMMLMGGSAVAGGPSGLLPTDRADLPAPFADSQAESRSGKGAETFRLFGLQESDEYHLISVDGHVTTDEPFLLQVPGTALLAADLSGENEVDEDGTPGAGDPDGSGTARLNLTFDPAEVCATLTVSDIALPAAAAHIHEGEAGVNGPVVVTLPTPGEDGTAEGCVTEGVTMELLREIAANPAGYYVNVHNATYPAGAVRGQLAQDPEAVVVTPGFQSIYRERLFAVDDSDPDNPQPTGDQIGTLLADCTAITIAEAAEDTSLLCTRMFTLDGRGDIALQESFTFADPLADTLAVTGGTGEFRDVGGQVYFDALPVEGENFTNSIYTLNLLHLK